LFSFIWCLSFSLARCLGVCTWRPTCWLWEVHIGTRH